MEHRNVHRHHAAGPEASSRGRATAARRRPLLTLLLVVAMLTTGLSGLATAAADDDCSTTVTEQTGSAIQEAIDALAPGGGVVCLQSGEYILGSTLNLEVPDVHIVGAGEDATTLDASSASAYGLLWTADRVSLTGLTLLGPSNGFGVKMQAPTSATQPVTGGRLTNVTVRGSGGTEIDLNYAHDVILTDVTADGEGTAGVGVGMISATDVQLIGLTTRGNNWGGVGVYTNPSVHYPSPGMVAGLTIAGLDANEPNVLYGQGANGGVISGLVAPQLGYRVRHPDHRAGGEDFTFYRPNETDAIEFVTALPGDDATATVRVADGPFIVAPGLSVQTALDAAGQGGTVLVNPGTYAENVRLSHSGVTLQGANRDTTIIEPTAGSAVQITAHLHGPLNGITVRGFTLAPPAGAFPLIALSGTVAQPYDTTNLTLRDLLVSGGTLGIGLNSVQDVTLQNVALHGIATPDGVGALEMTGVSNAQILQSQFTSNNLAIRLQSTEGLPANAYGSNGPVTIAGSTFEGNGATISNVNTGVVINAANNWWGTASGPGSIAGVTATSWCLTIACTTFGPVTPPPPPPVGGDVVPPPPPVVTPPAPNTPPAPITVPPGSSLSVPKGGASGIVGGQPVTPVKATVPPPPPPAERTPQQVQQIQQVITQILTSLTSKLPTSTPPPVTVTPTPTGAQVNGLLSTPGGQGTPVPAENVVSVSVGDTTVLATGGDGDGNSVAPDDDGTINTPQGGYIGTAVAGLTPNSPGQIVVLSDPQLLGTFTADADGLFRGQITVPDWLEPGEHTLVINGQSAQGEVAISMAITVAESQPFTDVAAGSTHAAAIARLKALGVTTGYEDGTYRPAAWMSRAQMAAFLARALGLDTDTVTTDLTDVAGTHAGAIAALVQSGIAGGYPDGTYRPAGTVTRGQMATFLANAAGLEPITEGGLSDVTGAHAGAINAIVAAGLANGHTDGTFRPGDPVNRAQMATFVVNLIDHLDDTDD